MKLLTEMVTQLASLNLTSEQELVVAYSGGVDSHVLLHALVAIRNEHKLKSQLSAIYINHGLSPNAERWQEHCEQVCSRLSVPFNAGRVSIKKDNQQSLEAQARDARYDKIFQLAPANSYVLLGQHQDDQLETFFLQLNRGAGPKGLSAMNQLWSRNGKSEQEKTVSFYRPLLSVSQQDILDYAHQYNLAWCEDESNENVNFDRNFLRHEVLPVLQTRWPELASTVSRSAKLCAEQQDLLDEISAGKLKPIVASRNSLHLPMLKELSQAWLYQLIRYWLSTMDILPPPHVLLNQLRPEMMDAREDANPIIQWQKWQFRRFDQKLYVIEVKPLVEHQRIDWQGQQAIGLPENLGILEFIHSNETHKREMSLDTNKGPISIQFGGFSARFTPAGSPYSKPLKQWFKQWKVPPWRRNEVVILRQNEQVVGVFIDSEWRISEGHAHELNADICIIYKK